MNDQRSSHLIIVCCNSIYHGGTASDPHHEENWALKSFQKSTASKQGEHETLIEHIQASIKIQQKKPHSSFVVFSGGATNKDYTDLSESQSYLNVLQALGTTKGSENILLDELATDSFQNIIFSIIAFRKHCGYYPLEITIVAHAFKERRFLDLHAKAIRWPADRIRVVGVDPPFSRMFLLQFVHPLCSSSKSITILCPALAVAQVLNIKLRIYRPLSYLQGCRTQHSRKSCPTHVPLLYTLTSMTSECSIFPLYTNTPNHVYSVLRRSICFQLYLPLHAH
jgi:hypothetical protein